ncbi:intersectin-1-like isoform X3 [Octopus vulgaris]|uniref:Intersectin-1-like isoform X3 n=1 Tax=Octopus vulgaris TaxID=6645 RepID=A0AA36FBV3_OCTVU|nr:intersectin-1-like isoform X3 [Octopus vulgaris]
MQGTFKVSKAVDPTQFKKDQREQMKKIWQDKKMHSHFLKNKDEIDWNRTCRDRIAGSNVTPTTGPEEDDNWKLILFIVLPVCLAVVAFIVVAILVRCLRRRKAAKQARRVIPDLWIHHSQELPLYAVECPLGDQPNEQLPSPKADLSTICEVLQSYVPQSPKELHLEKGEFLKVVEKDCNGWCRGVMGTDIGWFPGSYVKEIRTASLIEASEEETEKETPTLQRLKPRVSSFMIKKRVSKDIQDNYYIDDQQMSRSHSELTDTISLPRSRTSTAGSSSVGEGEHIRFQQRSPSILLDIPGRLQNGYTDQRLSVGSLSQNQRDNNNNAQRRLSSRRVEPPSLLLQIPIQGRTTPLLRPTRPAPPPPPSRKPIRSVSPSSTATSPLTETTPITPLTPTLLQTPAEETDVIVTTITSPPTPTTPATTQIATTEGVAAAVAATTTEAAPVVITANPVIIGIDGKEDETRTTAIPSPLPSVEPNLESNQDNQLELTNHVSTPLIQSQENLQLQSKIVNDVAPSGSLENGIEPLTEPLLQAETQCLPLSHYPNQPQTDSCET